MSTSLPFPPLARRCGLPNCDKTENLMRCARCKVRPYCSQQHQRFDFPDHKPACSAVAKAQKRLDREEARLRAEPGDDFMVPANPFETSVGHFWGIHGTRDYMRARYGVIDALRDVSTYDAVQKQLEHALDMLRLCRSDNMGIRDLVPALYLRLNRDQECYDFIRWYCTTGEDSQYDWGDMDLGYLDIHDANAFEPLTGMVQRFSSLGMMNSLALLKVKLLLNLLALKSAEDVPSLQVIPREILDAVRSHLPRSPIVSRNRALLRRVDHTAEIIELEDQVGQLYAHIQKSNPHCWGVLLYPGDLFEKDQRPGSYSMGSMEEAQIKLGFSYDAWVETPGALAVIKAKYDAQEG